MLEYYLNKSNHHQSLQLIKIFFDIFRFLVPYITGDGYCPASILKLYFDTVNEDHDENVTSGPLFWQGTGKPGTNTSDSKFLKGKKKHIGRVTLGNTGKEIARYLGLPEPEKYTGHCFR